MSLLLRIQKAFVSRMVISFLGLFLLIHLVLLYFYFEQNKATQQYSQYQLMIQKIYNVVSTLAVTPNDKLQAAVDALNDPQLQVTLSNQPTEDIHVNELSYWKIHQSLKDTQPVLFALSIHLPNQQWINIHAQVIKHIIFQQLILLSLELIIFMACFVSVWSIYRFTQPLHRFKQATRQLGIDLKSKPLDIYGPKIIQETAQALNEMQQRIHDLIQDRTQMLAAISHDLKTPITRLKLRTQFINTPSIEEEFINDLNEMEQMINETLTFAQHDYKAENCQDIDIVSLIQSLSDSLIDEGFPINIKSNKKRILFHGKPLSLKRAINNILINCKKFSSSATIHIRHTRGLLILIRDDGPGLQQQDLDRVFSPYYRAEHSRSRQTGGTGLGLTIAKEIIASHNGSITLKNRRPHGLSTIIKFS